MGGNIFEFLTDHPFAAVIIGFSWLVLAIFIYKLLKKDIKGLSKDIESLKELLIVKIEPIEKALSNHITETKAEIKELNKKVESKFEKLESKNDERFEKLDSKIESKFDMLDSKIDSLLAQKT